MKRSNDGAAYSLMVTYIRELEMLQHAASAC